ncbi:sulfite exporter TauE/SafE family protein [Grimontia sp. NTOU-MAR1]|uniref:sulfite exporter TauE/SafE family protein n=1 Tax=Grimontia sp. NTOU-MAR1 TaxID=3111011 RepID=UPI002DBE571B|nr:sulfite exporter TauE/SafE family protein [Grimontia sp. NTOU-MAR1]WRV99121.1 sulfite exporter TauE/SafE family protein [Grimontia sp. NTOU-MAR1]
MDFLSTFGLFIGSLIANTLASLAGGGAGLLQLPLLLFLGLGFSVALATHKVASVALGLGAALKHWRSGNLDPKLTLYVTLAGAAGVIGGANLILFVPGPLAEGLLGGFIILLGVYSRMRKTLGQEAEPKHRDKMGMVLGCLGLSAIGLLNGSLTAGTGLFVTLFLVRWFGFDYKQAVALTLVSVGIFWNGLGAATLAIAGAAIYWPWIPALLAGSILGGYLGAYLADKYSNKMIKIAFELLTFAVGIKLLWGVL